MLRSTLIYAPAILATRLSALLILVIATRLVNLDEYGLLALVVTIGEMTDVAIANWLRVALLRLGGKGDVTQGSLWMAGRILLVSMVIALFVSTTVSIVVVPERMIEFSIAVGAYLVAGAVNRFALTTLQMQQRHVAYSMLEFSRAALQLVLPIGAILVFPHSFLTVSLGSSAAVLLAGFVAAFVASSRLVPGPARFSWVEFMKLGLPLIAMAVVSFGLSNFERIVLKVYYDAGSVAIFAAAYALARQPIDMLANAVNMGAFPEAVSRFDADGPKAAADYLSQLLALILGLVLPAATLLVALSDPLVQLLLPADYYGKFSVLFPLIAASVVFSNVTSFVYGTMILAHKRSRSLISGAVVGSLATIGLSYLLIPGLAGTGAAIALVAGSFINLVAIYLISERLTPVPIPWRELGLSVLIAVVAGGLAGFINAALVHEAAIVRLIVGGGAGALAFIGLNIALRFQETVEIVVLARAKCGGAKC
ncbi:MAG: polysaccharide biosynthesis C-terminal domain-containing protein [Devosia sp.]